MEDDNDTLLTVDNLHVEFSSGQTQLEAVHGVNLQVKHGRTLAVVGESGSGKSVTAMSILGLLGSNGQISNGRIQWKGEFIENKNNHEMRSIRGTEIATIFQDPMAALDPLYTAGHQVSNAIRYHRSVSKETARKETLRLFERVGLPDPKTKYNAYPHQLSGGQRQRVMIAGAIAPSPSMVIADEPTTALDVTIETQVLELIAELKREIGLAVLLITHDMGVVAEVADEVAVMYAGEIVETGSVRDVLTRPKHPYTKALLSAIPTPQIPRTQSISSIPGVVPALNAMPRGCRFSTRCKFVEQRCRTELQDLRQIDDQLVRCWKAEIIEPESSNTNG